MGLSGGGRVSHVGGLLVAISGVPDQTQQVAVVDGPVEDPLASILAAEALFLAAGWDPAIDLVAGAHPRLEAALASRGYAVVSERPGMVRGLADLGATDPLADAHVTVASARQLVELAAVQARAFDMDRGVAELLLPPATVSTPGVEVLVITDERGQVLGGLTLHLDGDVAGIVGAAVDPDHQRRGLGAALTATALRRASASGARAVWLQATEAGLPLWRGRGFVEVGSCQVWLVSHEAPPELHSGLRPTGL